MDVIVYLRYDLRQSILIKECPWYFCGRSVAIYFGGHAHSCAVLHVLCTGQHFHNGSSARSNNEHYCLSGNPAHRLWISYWYALFIYCRLVPEKRYTLYTQYVPWIPFYLKFIQWNQYKMIKRTSIHFKAGIAYFTSNAIVATDGSSQRSNEAFMAKI